MKPMIVLAAAALAVIPAAVSAQSTGVATQTVSAKQYVAMAAASDLYEMESSKLVMATSDPKLKSYATMMIADHTKSTKAVAAAAKADGMTPAPPKLMQKQATMISELKKVSGPQRDALYKTQQTVAHSETLAFQRTYAQSGDMPHLKSAAGKIVPVVEAHLSEIKAM